MRGTALRNTTPPGCFTLQGSQRIRLMSCGHERASPNEDSGERTGLLDHAGKVIRLRRKPLRCRVQVMANDVAWASGAPAATWR